MSTVGVLPISPFKGLAPFEDSELDALLFFGREREAEVIVSNLLASRLTVLYGPSGVGKSSVLRAAVARRLREVAPDAEVAVLADWAAQPSLPWPDDEAFLILDQFEEYFVYHDEEPLLEQLLPLLERPRVHVLIALREDALARLDAFEIRVPNVFANRLRLDHLDALAARGAIVGPLDRWNAIVGEADRMGIEMELIDAVLEEVTAPEQSNGSPGSGRIEAPYLQLIMERVWEEERAAGSSVLRADTLRRLGGARAIVSTHLERALLALPPRDAAIATSALKFLVTPSRTKIAHSFGDLVDYTDESPVELHAVLERLASQRILRSVSERGEDGRRYEIFHDILAEPVLAWRREFDTRAALERERAVASRRHRRLLVIAGGAAILAAAMIVLAAYAFTQRSEAVKQRHAAQAHALAEREQKLTAQKQRSVARAARATALVQKRKADRAAAAAHASAARAEKSLEQANRSEAQAKRSAEQARRSEGQAKQSETFALHEQRIANAQLIAARQQKKVALERRRQAVAATKKAELQTRLEHVLELVATADAKLDVDPVQSLRAALEASTLDAGRRFSARVEDALRGSLVALRLRAILDGGGGPVNAAVFNLDGSLVATATGAGVVRIFQTSTHNLRRTLQVKSPVETVSFSPDGKLLAAAARDGRALLYDVQSGDLLRTLHHDGRVLTLAFAGGGRYLVTGSTDGMVRIWDTSTYELLHAIPGRSAVQAVAINPDGSLAVAIFAGDAVSRIYDVALGVPVGSVQQQGEVTAAAFSPNGAYLVTTGRRNGYVWSTSDWSLLHLLVGHSAVITDVVFARDGRVVTTSIDSSARLWDPATGVGISVLANGLHQKVLAAAVSPDGSEIATVGADQTASIFNTPLGQLAILLAGHTDTVTGISFSPDGGLVLTGSADGDARLWDPTVLGLAPLGSQAGAIATVSYSPDGRLVVSAGADGTAQIWSASGGGAVQTLRQGGSVTDASFTADGSEVLTASEDGTAKLWRVLDGSLLANFAHGAPVRAALAAGSDVLSAGDDGVVRMWTSRGTLIWAGTHGSPITAAAFSRDGVVATGAADGTVRLWRSRDGAKLAMLRGHTGPITSLAFSPEGSMLASGSGDSTAHIWDVKAGTSLHSLVGHAFGVTSVAFSPDGRLVLTASIDGDARLWSVATGRTVHRLSFHVATISQASFSPDGRWIVTAGPSTAGLWLTRTGKLLYYLGGASGQLTSASFAPDSRRIVVGSTGGAVTTFRCAVCGPIPVLQAQARQALKTLRPVGRTG
jgi:WD40 repeat protein